MKGLTLVLALPALCTTLSAAEWPHWRGPNHDGISKETDWQGKWTGEPKALWRTKVGEGFSSMSIADGRVFTMGITARSEQVFCLDALTGREVWRHSWPSTFKAQFYEGGTSGTPTLEGDRVYVLGLSGELMALEASTGKPVWQKNLAQELKLKAGVWGFVGAPLVDGDRLILNAGTHGTAVDKKTGRVIWSSGTEDTGYSTPLPFEHGGRDLVALMGKENLFAVERATGRLVWKHPWKTKYDVNAADPILAEGQMLVSSGYGHGAALLSMTNNGASVVWENTKLRSMMNPGVLLGGHVYGFDGNADGKPTLTCLELQSGQVRWRQDGLGLGSLLAADGKLIILSEKGELIIAEATPRAFTPLSRAQILGGKCWTVPVLANGLLYARNWKGDLVCIDLRG
ncbi:MAG: PQQ-binding-like beta-propeller repeat protein [Verrucomicrobiales bacterium]